MNFDQAFDTLLGHEGEYSNHPSDPGGETMWGITKRVAVKEGYTGSMRLMPRETAKAIYFRRYWQAIQADKIPVAARYVVFDAAANSGVKQSVMWLQRALDVVDDGVMGPMTIEALNRAQPVAVAIKFLSERLDFLTNLPTWGSFGRGWARRIASNMKGIVQ